MPYVRVSRKRTRSFSRRSRSRSSSSSRSSGRGTSGAVSVYAASRPTRGYSRPLVVSRNVRTAAILPERLETTMSCNQSVYWPAGRMTAAAGNYFSIYANSPTNPFYTPTFNLNTGTGSYSFGNNAVFVQGTNITQSCIGWSTLAALYANYRVVKYRIEITAQAASAADVYRVVAVALGQEEYPSSAAASMDLRVMESQPFSKCMTVSSSDTGGNSTIVLEGYPYRDLGLTKEAYMGLPVTSVGGFPTAGVADYIGVFTQALTGTNNAAICSMQIKCTYDVVFTDLVNQIN